MATPKKPESRTVRIELPEPYAGFYVIARADFPARTLIELQSGDFERALTAFDALVTEHNLTDQDGKPAATMLDADPFAMVEKALAAWGDELGKLQRQ